MTFSTSSSPDITEALPAPLAGEGGAATTASRGRVRWDISVNGIGFNLGINDQHPYIRESAPAQKQQTDVSSEAGEQTLDGFWIRSQTSWHLGAGANFYEPGARDGITPSQYRYSESVGVDVWTEGDVRLLKRTSLAQAAAGTCYVTGARVSGADAYFTLTNSVLRRNATSYTNPASGAPASRPALAGTKILVGTATAIAAGDATGSALTDLWTAAPAAPTPYWAKGRIIATSGHRLYELTLAGGAFPATPTFTHPDTGWTWSAVAETPAAILAAGYSNGLSTIYSLTLETDTGGTTPKLGQPFQVAEFPPGEEVHSLKVYLGTYVGIGTSRGVRVGLIGGNGEIQYGPLLFKTTQPVRALAARDSFLYAGVENEIEGLSGCARVDLGRPIGDGLIFPWAWDAQAKVTGTVHAVAFDGLSDRVLLAVQAQGVYAQSATAYEATGHLCSGAVRYGTTEAKAFRYADVRCKTDSDSSVALSIVGPSDEEIDIVSLSSGALGSNLSLARLAQRLEYVSYKVSLTCSTDTLTSPVIESVALKAVPAVKKQRMLQYPVLFHEKQQDGTRAPLRRDIPALIAELETLEETEAVVQVNDYRTGESFPASIESFRFVGTTPPTSKPGAAHNVGGRGELTVRKLA